MSITSYSSIVALGHRQAAAIFDGSVLIQEKIDGSQMSAMLNPETNDLEFRSKNCHIDPLHNCPKQFSPAVQYLLTQKEGFVPGAIYRGECVTSNRHNALTYDRTPKGGFILFDVEDSEFAEKKTLHAYASDIGVECVPTFYEGETSYDAIQSKKEEWLARESVLGGRIEGFVLKNYNQWTPDHKVLMTKVVQKDMHELITKAQRKDRPTQGDFIKSLIDEYKSENRYAKAAQHLRDNGVLTNTPKDIGPLIKETKEDIEKECRDEIMAKLYAHFSKQIFSAIACDVPNWYKRSLGIL